MKPDWVCTLFVMSSLRDRDTDIIFARVKDRAARDIGYVGFMDALSACASKKQVDRTPLFHHHTLL